MVREEGAGTRVRDALGHTVELEQRRNSRDRRSSRHSLCSAIGSLTAGPARSLTRLVRADLVILDELGYLPFSQAGDALLFHLLSKLCERTSVMITTNLSFSQWSTRVRRSEE